jgi:hypothetical protein
MQKLYISIRVVTAQNKTQAIEEVQKQNFLEAHLLCDEVVELTPELSTLISSL